MKISVIIPAYNAEGELTVTLEHLFRSDCGDFEVIVVDDASNDRTVEVAERFPVTIVRQEANGGAAKARNKGARVATGDILFFIDADVRVETSTLDLIQKTFESDRALSAIVGAYTPEQPVPCFYSHFQNFYTYYNHDKCLDGMKGPISWFWTACGAVKRDIFEEMGGFREIYVGASAEDMDFGYRLSDAGYTISLDKKIEVVHAHRHSMKSILKNNVKKAAAWGELYLRKNRTGQYKHGFTSFRNYATMILVALLTLSLVNVIWIPWALIVLVSVLVGIVLVNREFYVLLFSHSGLLFTLKAILFHILATFFAGLGGLLAILRRLTGKEGEVELDAGPTLPGSGENSSASATNAAKH